MAYTFTVEDGTVVAGANSYVTVAFADDYFAVDSNFAATWTGYSSTVKQKLLSWATRVLDQKAVWNGNKTDVDSALRWPRTYVYDADGLQIEDDEIPTQLMQATCELAKYLVDNDPTVAQDTTNFAELTVDVITVKYQDSTWQQTVPPLLNQLLTGLGRFRVGGSGFGRIIKG